MAPSKMILVEIVGALPHGMPRADTCTRNLVSDIPHMSTDTLLYMQQNCSRKVRTAIMAELQVRDPTLAQEIASPDSTRITGWQRAPIDVCDDDSCDDEELVFDTFFDDDFIPFGEVPKI